MPYELNIDEALKVPTEELRRRMDIRTRKTGSGHYIVTPLYGDGIRITNGRNFTPQRWNGGWAVEEAFGDEPTSIHRTKREAVRAAMTISIERNEAVSAAYHQQQDAS